MWAKRICEQIGIEPYFNNSVIYICLYPIIFFSGFSTLTMLYPTSSLSCSTLPSSTQLYITLPFPYLPSPCLVLPYLSIANLPCPTLPFSALPCYSLSCWYLSLSIRASFCLGWSLSCFELTQLTAFMVWPYYDNRFRSVISAALKSSFEVKIHSSLQCGTIIMINTCVWS